MPNTFFTSDTHFGHGNMIKYSHRPFLSPEDQAVLDSLGGVWHDGTWKGPRAHPYKISPESIALMDNALIENINKTVGENDILYHLGDFCMARGNYALHVQSYLQRIRCKTVQIIWGNHDEPDAPHPYSKFDSVGGLFSSEGYLRKINVHGQIIVLCHYAMNVWERSHRGSWHLYGHSHANAEKLLDSHFPQRRSMDVGVDNAKLLLGEYRPFAFEEIRELLKHRTGVTLDHHCDPNAPEEENIA